MLVVPPNKGDPRCSRGAYLSGAPCSDTNYSSDRDSNKAPATLEAQAVTRRAPGDLSSGSDGVGKMQVLKYSQRQSNKGNPKLVL